MADLHDMYRAAGVAPAKMERFARIVSSVAVATAADHEVIGAMFAWIKALGAVRISDLRDFIALGLPVPTMLAQSLGVEVREVIDSVARGKVTADQLLDAVEAGLSGTAADGGAR